MGLVPGRGKDKSEEYLNHLPDAERLEVMMDMREPYPQAVQMGLPGAHIVVNKFHVNCE